MSLIHINQEKCTACGLCIEVCPNILNMGENGPQETYPDLCIACGQCVAVCPQAALNNTLTPLPAQIAIDKERLPDASAAAQLLRSRRSIRHYRQPAVPKQQLSKLLNIARFAPTAGNRQGVSYIIVGSKSILKKATARTIDWMKLQSGGHTAIERSFAKHIKIYEESGTDVILRNAPQLILAVTVKGMPRGRENTIFSLAYLELYAPSLGLGTCWAGLLEMCMQDHYQPLLNIFSLPSDKEITGAVMVGYPKYHYQRLPDRAPLDVSWL